MKRPIQLLLASAVTLMRAAAQQSPPVPPAASAEPVALAAAASSEPAPPQLDHRAGFTLLQLLATQAAPFITMSSKLKDSAIRL